MKWDISDKLEEFKSLIVEVELSHGWVENIFWSCYTISNIREIVLYEYTWPEPKPIVVGAATTMNESYKCRKNQSYWDKITFVIYKNTKKVRWEMKINKNYNV